MVSDPVPPTATTSPLPNPLDDRLAGAAKLKASVPPALRVRLLLMVRVLVDDGETAGARWPEALIVTGPAMVPLPPSAAAVVPFPTVTVVFARLAPAPPLPTRRAPPLMLVTPVYWLALVNARVPAPTLVSEMFENDEATLLPPVRLQLPRFHVRPGCPILPL